MLVDTWAYGSSLHSMENVKIPFFCDNEQYPDIECSMEEPQGWNNLTENLKSGDLNKTDFEEEEVELNVVPVYVDVVRQGTDLVFVDFCSEFPVDHIGQFFIKIHNDPEDNLYEIQQAVKCNGVESSNYEIDSVKTTKQLEHQRNFSKIHLEHSRKFGKGYSSDNSGDGPKNKQKVKFITKKDKKLLKDVGRGIIKDTLKTVMPKQQAKMAYKLGAKISAKVRNKQPMIIPEFRSYQDRNTIILSKHSRKWLTAYLNPFDSAAKNASIPRPGSNPSYKVTGFVRGVGAIGLQGMGFVMMAPAMCNNKPSVYYSTEAFNGTRFNAPEYTGSVIDPIPSASNPAYANMSNLPFTYSQLDDQGTDYVVEGRIVATSLEVYYTGTEYYRSGQYFVYSDPEQNRVSSDNHASGTQPTGGYTVADLTTKDSTEIMHVGANNRARAIIVPSLPSMYDYPIQTAPLIRKLYPYSNGNGFSTTDGVANAVIAITGTPGQSFYFEMITHVEYVGPGVPQSLLTDCANDVLGFDCLSTILGRAQRRAASDSRHNLSQCIKQELNKEKVKY